MLAANLAADVDAWLRLLPLHGIDDLAEAEPDTMRFRLHHLPSSQTTLATEGYGSSGLDLGRPSSPPVGNDSPP